MTTNKYLIKHSHTDGTPRFEVMECYIDRFGFDSEFRLGSFQTEQEARIFIHHINTPNLIVEV